MSEQVSMTDNSSLEELCVKMDEIESFLDKNVSTENIFSLIQTFFTATNELIKLEIIHTVEILSSCISDPVLKTIVNCFLDSNYVRIEPNKRNELEY